MQFLVVGQMSFLLLVIEDFHMYYQELISAKGTFGTCRLLVLHSYTYYYIVDTFILIIVHTTVDYNYISVRQQLQ